MGHSNRVSEQIFLEKKKLKEQAEELKKKDDELKKVKGKSSAISQLLELQNSLPCPYGNTLKCIALTLLE